MLLPLQPWLSTGGLHSKSWLETPCSVGCCVLSMGLGNRLLCQFLWQTDIQNMLLGAECQLGISWGELVVWLQGSFLFMLCRAAWTHTIQTGVQSPTLELAVPQCCAFQCGTTWVKTKGGHSQWTPLRLTFSLFMTLADNYCQKHDVLKRIQQKFEL